MSYDAQVKFASRLAKKKKITAKQLAMQTEIDLPLSSEMQQWLGSAMENTEEGYLDDMVSNPLAKPLDAMALYTPLGSIAKSQYAAVRPLESTYEREDRELRERKASRLLNSGSTGVGGLNVSSIGLGNSQSQRSLNNQTQDEGMGYTPSFSQAHDEFKNRDDSYDVEEIRLPDSVSDLGKYSQKGGGGGGYTGTGGITEKDSFFTAVNTFNQSQDDTARSHATTWSSQKAVENRPKPMLVNEAMKRLEVLWLKRRAQIEMDEGDHAKALATLKDAMDIHIGTDDYLKADLGSHMHKDPESVLSYIAETYYDFDVTAHLDAGRIQRCVIRWLDRRRKRVLIIQRFYRGHRVRMMLSKNKQMRKQTAQIIQRAFRRHLAHRSYNATKIKMWYLKLKLMEDFKAKMFYFRAAYRVQRLWRGYVGRTVAALRRKELDSTSLVQRQARKWRITQQRALALERIHSRYYGAARVIQCIIRRVLSIKRSQMQILREMLKEEERHEHEQEVVEQSIAMQLKKVHLYMKTEPGRVHFRYTQERIRAKDKQFKKTKKAGELSEEAILAHDAMVSFELFDTDGSGFIDEDELSNMLVQLAIPMDEAGVKRLALEIDGDGSGDIDFGEFLDWYSGGGSQDVIDNQTYDEKFFKQILKARTYMLEVTGVILHQRTTRDMLRQATTWQSKDIAATFRNTHPPKFQCCQCMEPFVFFADYTEHFDKKGRCSVLKEKAVFFESFWVKKDWNYQRQIEREVRRLKDEIPNINYNSLLATFHDIALQKNSGLHELTTSYIRRAQMMYMSKYDEDGGTSKTMGEEIIEVVKLCGEHLNPLIAMTVAECVGTKIPDDWILEDRWDMDEFSDWIDEVVDKGAALRPPPLYTKLCNQEVEKLKQDTWLLASIYVRVVRLHQVTSESSLIALMECRSRRPRTMTIPDKVLREKGLEHLTKKAFNLAQSNIVQRLRLANDAMEKLTTIYVPTRCQKLLKDTTGSIQVGPDGKLSPEELRKVFIKDAHVRAYASYQSRSRSLVGKTQVRRLANELWAIRLQRRRDGKSIAAEQGLQVTAARSLFAPTVNEVGDLLYFYDRFASEATGDGIDMWDIDIVQRALALKIPDVKWPEALAVLDPKKTGYITFDRLFIWIMGRSHKPYYSYVRGFKNMSEYMLWSVLDTIYVLHAEQLLLMIMRKVSRLELDYRSKSLEILLLQSSVPDNDEEEDESDAKSPAATAEEADEELTSSEELAQAKTAETLVADANAEKEKKLAADKLEADKLRIKVLQTEAAELNEKLLKIKNADEQGEALLLFRLEENEAEAKCKSEFLSRKGMYNLRTEMRIMSAANKIIEAYGFLISPGARYPGTAKMYGDRVLAIEPQDVELWTSIQNKHTTVNSESETNAVEGEGKGASSSSGKFDTDFEIGWALALAVLVYAYDTDCSGSFDEGEVKLLLSNSLCGLHERKVLLNFPEVKDDSATLHTMVNYLAPRVFWGRGWLCRLGFRGSTFIITKPNLSAASSMLISLNRQYARSKAEEAEELTRTGKMKEEDDAKNDDALMMRAQMFAMRQVELFLKTIQGRFKYRETKRKVAYWWTEDCWRKGFSREGLLQYAYQVHADWKGLLITELPHLIRFCIVYLRFFATPFVSEIAKMMANVRTKSDVYWLPREDVLLLLDKALASTTSTIEALRQKPQVFLHRVFFWTKGRDARLNMLSKARQQAVLISLQFEGILVSDTNYRCSVLGLHDVMHRISQTSGSWNPFRRKENQHPSLNWEKAPREATMFLLLSKGYFVEDLLIGDVQKWAEVEHKDGGLAAGVVNVKECVLNTNAEVSRSFRNDGFVGTAVGYLQAARRWLNFATGWTGGPVHYMNYKRVGTAIMTEGKQVNKEGAKYLRELLTGQSHCVDGG